MLKYKIILRIIMTSQSSISLVQQLLNNQLYFFFYDNLAYKLGRTSSNANPRVQTNNNNNDQVQ